MPLLLLLMLGTLDLGQMFFGYIQVRNAVREGAAYGSRHPDDSVAIAAKVRAHNTPDALAVSSSLAGNCTTVGGQGTVTVEGSWVFTPITLSFFSQFGLGPVAMDVSATMRCMT
jgi:Flp pilus assembly protein TadG